MTVSATTGFLKWKTVDQTDLDYTPLPLVTRDNLEESFQFTQESASPRRPARRCASPIWPRSSGRRACFFTQNYDQDATRNFSAGFLSPFFPFPVVQTSPQAELGDVGVGLFGQGVVTLAERVDLTAGVRFDHEQKDATLDVFFTPAIAPPQQTVADEGFSNVSPQFAAAFHLQPGKTIYASVANGTRQAGSTRVAARHEVYGEEHTWNFEGGVKTMWANGRVAANAAVFHINWEDMQLNLPNLFAPGEFYVANVGGATSSGVELELNARVHPNVDVFGGFGYTKATFKDDSISGGIAVGGTRSQIRRTTPPRSVSSCHGRWHRAVALRPRGGDIDGRLEYDDLNTQSQDAYSLANFRAGVRGRLVFVEGWIRNAFDTEYIPIASRTVPWRRRGLLVKWEDPGRLVFRRGGLLKFKGQTFKVGK